HWALGILLRHLSFERGYAPLCRLNRGQKVGSRFSPSHLLTLIDKSVAQQHKPKSLTIHHSPFTIQKLLNSHFSLLTSNFPKEIR
ncbi:hypothetical protein, partial [Nitratifractor sp.]